MLLDDRPLCAYREETMHGNFRVNRQFLLKIAAPTIFISGVLFALGILAAWNTQRQHQQSSELIAKEVHGMLAAQDLYIELREMRHRLQEYARVRGQRFREDIRRLRRTSDGHLAQARKLAHTPDEIHAIETVNTRWSEVVGHFDEFLMEPPTEQSQTPEAMEILLDDISNVVDSAYQFLLLNRDVVDQTNEANRRTAEHSQQAFLLLGICGGASGLVAGLVIARSVGASMVQLNVSIRGAAGKMSDVVGPLKISRSGSFQELAAGLQEMESHVSLLVERVQQQELEALHREQLAALGQIAAGLAHELRNPLMPIKMLVQDALDRPDGAGLQRESLNVIAREVTRLESSLQDFLDFARPPAIEKATVDLRSLIEQTIELVASRAAAQSVTVISQLPDHSINAPVDVVRLRQVLLNLLLNALDELASGGTITVSLTVDSATNTTTRFALITIRDNGPGFTAEILDRLFQPFASTKETGTGLGLSICERMIAAHDGRITARNHPEGGAEVTVALPIASGPSPA